MSSYHGVCNIYLFIDQTKCSSYELVVGTTLVIVTSNKHSWLSHKQTPSSQSSLKQVPFSSEVFFISSKFYPSLPSIRIPSTSRPAKDGSSLFLSSVDAPSEELCYLKPVDL